MGKRVRELLNEAASQYQEILAQVSSPALDARLILSWIMGIDQAKLLALLQDEVEEGHIKAFHRAWQRRLAGEPVAYITGTKEFWGLKLKVDPRVLIPRPDSETLVEAVLDRHREPGLRLIDCCTGSGCIALALASERPEWEIWASDISEGALQLARENCDIHFPGRIRLVKRDLLEGFEPGTWDIIVSNPPYLSQDETEKRLNAGWKEPELALLSGQDGLEHIRRIIRQAAYLLRRGACLYIESSPSQTSAIRDLLSDADFTDIYSIADLTGQERVSRGCRSF